MVESQQLLNICIGSNKRQKSVPDDTIVFEKTLR
jgi:hypothetical protein